jgi:hypothetical protein
LLLAAGLVHTAGVQSYSQLSAPDLKLRVAVRQNEDGKVADGIHIITLQCARRECALTAVSLNRCDTSPLGTPASPVVVEFSSTRDGTLRVTNLGDTLKVEEVASDIGGDATSTFLFGYELVRGTARLTSFSGGFVKHSLLLGRVISVEYQPFRRWAQSVTLDCPVLLPGVDSSEWDDLIEALPAPDRTVWKRIEKDPDRPFLTDERRARRLFPDYDRMKAQGQDFTDEQWKRYVTAFLDELATWLEAKGMSAEARVTIRKFQAEALLEQLKRR